MTGFRLLCCGLLAALPPIASRAFAQQPTPPPAQRDVRRISAPPKNSPDTIEPVLIDLRLELAATATVQAFRIHDQALIPVGQFLDLAEISHTIDPTGRIEGVIEPAGDHFVIDGRLDTIVIGARKIALRQTERLTRDGETYLDVDKLGPMFGVQFKVEWADLLVVVPEAGQLPLLRRLRRDLARAGLLRDFRAGSPAYSGLSLGLARPPADGAVFDYTLSVPSQNPREGTSAAFAFGANLFGGSLAATTSSGAGYGIRNNTYDVSWTGVWLHQQWLKQLRLGQGTTTGPVPRLARGISLSNSPYIREPAFGVGRYTGATGSRWEIEAYRAGTLVAVDTADITGRFAIAFPITYGDNPVDFLTFGPHGEESRFNRSYRVVQELVPPGQFEYGLSAGRCFSAASCTYTGNADLRYGLNGTWTARTGIDHFARDSIGSLSHPYARLTGLLTNTISLDLKTTLHAETGAEISLQPTLDRRVTVSYSVYDTNVVQPILSPAKQSSQLAVRGFFRPVSSGAPFFVQWDAERTVLGSSTLSFVELLPTFQSAKIRWLPRLRLERVDAASGLQTNRVVTGLNTFAFLPSRWGPWARRMSASTTFESEGRLGITQKSISLITRLPGRDMLLTTGVAQGLGSSPIYTFSLITNQAWFRSFTQGTAQRGATGYSTALQTIQGSVLYNREARDLSFIPGPALERSGVTGRVYLDNNGNGVFDAGDVPLRGVFVRAASSGGSTDSAGRYSVWDVPTFTRALVSIDSGSLESPLWIPAEAAIAIEPAPNHFRAIDLAVLPGGTIEGTVYRQSGAERLGLPGVRVLFRNEQTGERRQVSTFVDGSYALLGARPGSYEITIDDRIIKRFDGAFTPVRVTMRAERDGASLSGVDLRIIVAPPPAPVIVIAAPAPVGDSDGDGVKDDVDRCPGTPRGVHVDPVGCPILFGADRKTVTLRGVNFATGSARLTPGSLTVLDTVALSLLGIPDVKVEVGGHTDNVGSIALNTSLSQARAQSVMNYLAKKGVPISRMSAVGYGPTIPVAPNTTTASRALNRRVELRRLD